MGEVPEPARASPIQRGVATVRLSKRGVAKTWLPDQPPPHPLGSGLRNMAERLADLGGWLDVQSAPTTAPPSPGTSPCPHQWRSIGPDPGNQGLLPPSCDSNADAAKFFNERRVRAS